VTTAKTAITAITAEKSSPAFRMRRGAPLIRRRSCALCSHLPADQA
jgi:hypothetical protein